MKPLKDEKLTTKVKKRFTERFDMLEKSSQGAQIDFPDLRIELGEINNPEAGDYDDDHFIVNHDADGGEGKPVAGGGSKNNPTAFDKSVLQTSSEVFRMVKIDEPVRKTKQGLKLPTIKMKRQVEKKSPSPPPPQEKQK